MSKYVTYKTAMEARRLERNGYLTKDKTFAKQFFGELLEKGYKKIHLYEVLEPYVTPKEVNGYCIHSSRDGYIKLPEQKPQVRAAVPSKNDDFKVEVVNLAIIIEWILSSMSADTSELKKQIEKLKALV